MRTVVVWFGWTCWAICGLALAARPATAEDPARHYLCLEADEFRGIQTDLQVAVGSPIPVDKHTNWCSRMAIFPDTTQGGPSRILSLQAHAKRAHNSCWRDVVVPAAGKYRLWVRYGDWRHKTEFFKVKIEQAGTTRTEHEFGAEPVISETDEMKLRVEFAYAWDHVDCALERGPAHITLFTDRVADADRDVDSLILTDDLGYRPRERGAVTPAYGAYLDHWLRERPPLPPLVPAATAFPVPAAWKPRPLAGRDFWFTGWQIEASAAEVNAADWPAGWLRKKFNEPVLPILSDPDTALWLRFGSEHWPETLAPGKRFARWLKDSRRAFWIEATWAAFHHPRPGVDYLKVFKQIKVDFGEQFLGFYLLEGPFYPMSSLPPETTRTAAYEAAKKFLRQDIAHNSWQKIFNADVGAMAGEYFGTPGFTCPAMIPILFEVGNTFVGNELGDSGSADGPLRQAFNRGLARQYGGRWGSHFSAFGYESGPPSDTTTGYGNWLFGRSGDLYGMSISITRRTAYLAWLSGSSVHHFEDIPSIFWKHWHQGDKFTLTPRGQALAEFLAATRKYDRGVPYTPIAFLMDKGHGWTNYSLTPYRIWNNLPPAEADYATDQHFEALSWPLRRDMALIERDEQVLMPHGIIGDTYDVLVTSDAHAGAVDDYRVVWLVGDPRLNRTWSAKLRNYVEAGGTLVANVEQVRGLWDEAFLGARLTGQRGEDRLAKCLASGITLPSSEFEFERVEPTTARAVVVSGSGAPLVTVNAVGKGQVVLTTPRWLMSRDGWALPLLPHLALRLASGLLPVSVRGDVEYCLNRTERGWLVGLLNNKGVYKMAHAQAVVRREEAAAVEISYRGQVHSRLTVPPGDVRLVEIRDR